MRLVVALVPALILVGGDAAGEKELSPRKNIRKVEHRPADDAPSEGPTTAPVTIDLFIVPGAGPTRQPFENFRRLQEAHPSRIRLVYRMVNRSAALLAPLAAAEAHAQGKFFDFMAVLNKRSNLRREEIVELAKQAGLDVARLEAAWADGRHEAALVANEQRRQRLHAGRNNLPTAVMNGEVIGHPLANIAFDELEDLYVAAYERAMDQLDRGVPIAHLATAFDRVAMRTHTDIELAPGAIDDPDPTEPLDAPPALLSAPLDSRTWPSTGPADAPVTVTVLCNLRTPACRKQLIDIALKVRDLFADEVRVVWGPMFDPTSHEATGATMINDAALCAEELGAGWVWVEQAAQLANRRHGRPTDPDKDIDEVIAATELDHAAVARCLASGAGASARTVERLRDSGVRSGPTIVVGGRIYPGGTSDYRMLQVLVEEELAPGILEELAPDWTE
jgi:protein-disulfide isomerase